MYERSNGRRVKQTASSLNGELQVTTTAGMKDRATMKNGWPRSA